MNIFLHYVIIDLVFGGTKRAKFASPPLTSPWIYILHCNYLFRIRWHQNLTLCYFLFSIRWHQKGSVCFWHPLASPWIYSYIMLFFISYSVAPKSYIMLFFISYSVTPDQFASAPLASPWIYSYVMLFFIYFVFGGTKSLSMLLPLYYIFLRLVFFIYFLFGRHQKGSVCFCPSNITMNIFLHYVIIDLVFSGTKRAKFASPPLTSPWIYILHCNYLFRIRWHQNLTLCYFLFSIRWHQKGSVCFWHL